jgi:hypothetical protein
MPTCSAYRDDVRACLPRRAAVKRRAKSR